MIVALAVFATVVVAVVVVVWNQQGVSRFLTVQNELGEADHAQDLDHYAEEGSQEETGQAADLYLREARSARP